MKSGTTYSIKYVASQTGLKPYLIRSWESRYQAICPSRSGNNRRCFTDGDVERLRLLKQAVDQGHPISSVAKIDNSALRNLLKRHLALHGSPEAFANEVTTREGDDDTQAAEFVEQALFHTQRLNPAALEQVLEEAAVNMPRQFFLQAVVLPFFERIGALWRRGQLKTINEHMASVTVRTILWDVLRSAVISRAAPRIVVATPVGHWHEFGALASALAASESGWRPLYFGPNLPAEEIAYAVKELKAKALALSLCHRLQDHRLGGELKKLRRLVGRDMAIFIGGPGGTSVQNTLSQIEAVHGLDLTEFRDKLEYLASE